LKLLLLGGDTPVGHSLRAFIPPLQRHELVLTPLEGTRWKRERQVKKMLRAVAPDMIVDSRIISFWDGSESVSTAELERTQWLARSAQRLGIRYFYLSSSQVFAGSLKRPYRESDTPDSQEPKGQLLLKAEQLVRDTVEDAFVLRLGWLFSGRGPSHFKLMLDQLRAGEVLKASDSRRDCPVHTAEVARVVAGIIDQISVGAPARGLYHYGSAGDTGYFAFCEALVAFASQFDVFSHATELLAEESMPEGFAINRSLDCTAIRHQFGIQRRPWRDFVERAVRRYIELYCKEVSHDR